MDRRANSSSTAGSFPTPEGLGAVSGCALDQSRPLMDASSRKMTTPLTGKNQITVPAEIAQKLGLQAGARFDWALSEEPNRIVITVQPTRRQLLERVRTIGRAARKAGKDPVADLVREREEDDRIAQEVASLAFELRQRVALRIPNGDALIAATAKSVNAVLVHRDPHLGSIPTRLVKQVVLPQRPSDR